MKPGVPLAIGEQPDDVIARFCKSGSGTNWHPAAQTGPRLVDRRRQSNGLRFTDNAGEMDLPFPSLPGPHQFDNAGIAIAALRAAGLGIPDAAIARGIATAEWPARLQRLSGHLATLLPATWELWLDGGP